MSGESENWAGYHGHAGQQPGGQDTVGGGEQQRRWQWQWQWQPDHDQRRWPQLDLAQHPSQYRLVVDLLVTPAPSVRSREQQRRWQPGDGEPLIHD
jgi:hypothetical protein